MDVPAAGLCGLDPFSPELREPSQAQVHTTHVCGAGTHVCSISVQGDVNPCSFLGPSFNGGNIRDTPFPILWRQSQQFQRMRRPVEEGFRGGCRARAQTFAGSVDAADPWFEEHRQQGGAIHPGSNVELVSLPLLPSE